MSGAGASTAVCVTGMHRSGTSFVASALGALGISLGDPDRLMRPGPDNPAGYYEVQSILDLNQELLAHLGGAWDAPPVLDPGWENDPGLAPFRSRALQVLDDSFGTSGERPPLIAFKDPRLSVLLPMWRLVTPIATTIVPGARPRRGRGLPRGAEVRASTVHRPRGSGCATCSRRRPTTRGTCSCGMATCSTISRARSGRSPRTSASRRPTPRRRHPRSRDSTRRSVTIESPGRPARTAR